MYQALGLVLALDKNHVWWSTWKSQHREEKTGGWGDEEHPLPHSSFQVHKRLYLRNKVREEDELKATVRKHQSASSLEAACSLFCSSALSVNDWVPWSLSWKNCKSFSMPHSETEKGRRNWKCCLSCGTIINAWWGMRGRRVEGETTRGWIHLDKKESLEAEQWECTENTQGQSGHGSGDLTLWTGLTADQWAGFYLLQMGRLQELCVSEMTHTLGLLVTCLLWTPSMKVHCSMILKAFRYEKSVLMSRCLQSIGRLPQGNQWKGLEVGAMEYLYSCRPVCFRILVWKE